MLIKPVNYLLSIVEEMEACIRQQLRQTPSHRRDPGGIVFQYRHNVSHRRQLYQQHSNRARVLCV